MGRAALVWEKLGIWADSPRVMRWVWRVVSAGCLLYCALLALACLFAWSSLHRAGYTLAPGESLDLFTLTSLDWQRAHHIRETLWLAVNLLATIVAMGRSVLPVDWGGAHEVRSQSASARCVCGEWQDDCGGADVKSDAMPTRTSGNSCDEGAEASSGSATTGGECTEPAVFCWPSQRPYEPGAMWRPVVRVAYRLLLAIFLAMFALEFVTMTALEVRSPIMICPAMRLTTPMVFVPELIPNALMTFAASAVLALTIAQSWLRAVRRRSS